MPPSLYKPAAIEVIKRVDACNKAITDILGPHPEHEALAGGLIMDCVRFRILLLEVSATDHAQTNEGIESLFSSCNGFCKNVEEGLGLTSVRPHTTTKNVVSA